MYGSDTISFCIQYSILYYSSFINICIYLHSLKLKLWIVKSCFSTWYATVQCLHTILEDWFVFGNKIWYYWMYVYWNFSKMFYYIYPIYYYILKFYINIVRNFMYWKKVPNFCSMVLQKFKNRFSFDFDKFVLCEESMW